MEKMQNKKEVKSEDTAKAVSAPDVSEKKVSREELLSGTSIKKLYEMFRKDGMKRIESIYNASYICFHNKYEETAEAVRDEFSSVPEHPTGWSNDKTKTHKSNIWSVLLKSMDKTASIIHSFGNIGKKITRGLKKIARIPSRLDSSHKAVSTILRLLGKISMPVCALLIVMYTVVNINSAANDRYSVSVYIDGEYVGCTDDINSILTMKKDYEKTLTAKYGAQALLKCEIKFAADTYDEENIILPGDVSIFEGYMSEYTKDGYGLYIDGKLAAVTESQNWIKTAVDEYVKMQEKAFYKYYSVTDMSDFVLTNRITVIPDKYPVSYFLTHNQLRAMFSLPAVIGGDENSSILESTHLIQDIDISDSDTAVGSFSYSHNITYANTGNSSSGEDGGSSGIVGGNAPSESVSVDLAYVREERESAEIPFDVDYIYDDTMYEGMRRLVSRGVSGKKETIYRVSYKKGVEQKREVIGENVIAQPKNKVVRIGSLPVPEDSEIFMPTGTYIYPYNGTLTSKYGWRILNGSNNFHQGIDIFGPRGDSVVASDGGEVIEVGYTKGYGNFVKIRHNEDIVTRYAHCDSIDVEVGDFVAQGQHVGTLGNTGYTTGVHVHFEVIADGSTVDPLKYLTGSIKE